MAEFLAALALIGGAAIVVVGVKQRRKSAAAATVFVLLGLAIALVGFVVLAALDQLSHGKWGLG